VKCLVPGGGGFIGTHLCEGLLAAGHEVRVLERPRLELDNATIVASQVEWIEGDFCNPADVKAAIAGCDVIFHLISTTLPKNSNENPVYDIESNAIATLRMLDLARQEKIRKVVFVSSGGTVYGKPLQIPIPESHPTDPLCSYGIGKLMIEKFLRLYRYLHGLNYCIVRLSNPFGEHQRPSASQGAVAVFLHKALKGETIEIWGDGSVVRDYHYIGDAIDALIKAMHHEGDCRLFNIGSGQGRSLNEVLAEIESLLGHPVTRKYTPARAFDVPANVLDISLARKHLGWEPRTSFEEGLRLTRDWMMRHSCGES
jgi:UDP-glucose 4-epimerase